MGAAVPAAVLASIIASAATESDAPAGARRLPEIRFEKYKLGNGIDVILHQDHSTPIV